MVLRFPREVTEQCDYINATEAPKVHKTQLACAPEWIAFVSNLIPRICPTETGVIVHYTGIYTSLLEIIFCEVF
jgi:hypothetical protein